ncbi:MAG: hypothetical protein WD875_14415 [Pirellulales bacterium]
MRRSKETTPPIASTRRTTRLLATATAWVLLAAVFGSTLVMAENAAAEKGVAEKGVAEKPAAIGAVHRFTHRAPAVGRTAEQDATFTLQLKATTVQGGTTVDEVESKLTRRQTRSTTVLSADDGRVTKVRVKFREAEQEVSGERRGGESIPAARADQAVAGKTYIVARAKPGDALTIADEQGKEPPEEEHRLVASSMDAVGRANVLGTFLDKRTVRVGQTVEMPRDAASEMLGFDKAVGEVAKFEMTLARVANRGGTLCGEFETRIEIQSPDAAGQSTRFRGRMIVEVGTCRSVEADFAGPVSFVENHGTAATGFQVLSVGALRVRVTSTSPTADRTAAKPAERGSRTPE